MKTRFLPFLAALALSGAAFAQSTAFTYQGALTEAGAPASGLHDFRFKFFDAASGGSQIGTTQCADNISVTDGVFTASLDFGQQFATPAPRFLEIQVRADTGLGCANNSGLVTLSPRQPLTAAPFANHAKSAFALHAPDGSPENALFVDNAGNVGIGTAAPTAKLDVRGPLSVANTGDGADLLWLNSDRSWVFRQDGAGATTGLKLQSVGGGGNKSFFFQTDGVVGIRSTAGKDVYVPGGEERLRLLRGTVSGNGSIIAGAGFGVVYLGEGEYSILFNPGFNSPPSVTVSAHAPDGGKPRWAQIRVILPGSFVVDFIDGGPNDRIDSDFSFCVMGP
jgi:hypothetical protein